MLIGLIQCGCHHIIQTVLIDINSIVHRQNKEHMQAFVRALIEIVSHKQKAHGTYQRRPFCVHVGKLLKQ